MNADPRIIHILTRQECVDYDRSSLYRTEAESDRIEQLVRLVRKEMWQDRIQWAVCFVAAVFIGFAIAVQL